MHPFELCSIEILWLETYPRIQVPHSLQWISQPLSCTWLLKTGGTSQARTTTLLLRSVAHEVCVRTYYYSSPNCISSFMLLHFWLIIYQKNSGHGADRTTRRTWFWNDNSNNIEGATGRFKHWLWDIDKKFYSKSSPSIECF